MITFTLNSEYIKDTQVSMLVGQYGNGRTALELIDSTDGEPVMVATVNVPDIPLEENEVIIKDYSENEGVLDCLIKEGIVSKPKRHISTGFVLCPVVDLLKY